jgi:hypothetical protein
MVHHSVVGYALCNRAYICILAGLSLGHTPAAAPNSGVLWGAGAGSQQPQTGVNVYIVGCGNSLLKHYNNSVAYPVQEHIHTDEEIRFILDGEGELLG